MAFFEEPSQHLKTALSDLQGTWENLREAVVLAHPFPDADRLLFHIDEAMSWESVRNLRYMEKILLVVQNIAAQSRAPAEVSEWVKAVRENFDEVLVAIDKGEI